MYFEFVDLFAGLGGFHQAARRLGGHCVLASELDADLRDLYRLNFGVNAHGDINELIASQVPSHDILFAGFPCQPFSKAGAQLGWKDVVRGTLFFKIIQILEAHEPQFVLLENVANFARHDGGNTFAAVKSSLEHLDYDVEYSYFSPHQFGIPQVRERIYIVARKRSAGGLIDFKWPSEVCGPLDISTVLEDSPVETRTISTLALRALDVWQDFLRQFPKDDDLPSFPIWAQEFGADYPVDRNSLFEFQKKELVFFRGSFGVKIAGKTKAEILEGVPSHARYEHNAFPDWKRTFIRQNRDLYEKNRGWIDEWKTKLVGLPSSFLKLEWNCKGSTRDIFDHVLQFRASGIRVKRRSYSPALVAMTTSQVPYIPWKNRFMTTGECARLQSMEDLIHIPKTSTLAFKSLGNAVNVKVVAGIMEALLLCGQDSIGEVQHLNSTMERGLVELV